ncbi:hypothetical protein CRP01_33300 [Flavilitoribacter nigricans DSM 23189 = NBRC 102662]|uniref:Glycosyltransferase 2-like domain-containing protein n=2 Tax=Flavilitoribacter TaxID=2762562 RepID=A0A2D0N381_FLAN2|nr:hypothetical protein CRP01_33300 [Flavilitoribacter nigricans DSM 23189 = NBRC 102662]
MLERYYRVYYGYVLDSLRYLKAGVKFGPDSSIGDAKFVIRIANTEIVIDYSDHLTLAPQFEKYPWYFKFHYSEGYHEAHDNLFPFSPVSFYDWQQYHYLRQQIKYTANGEMILSRQYPHGNALHRRKQVQHLLKDRYGALAATERIEQVQFWKEISNSLVSVCVPGARNNILDRGHLQYLAFGACTISPKIITMLPGFRKLIPDVHYIQCSDDYSDLPEKIAHCRKDRKRCVEIGRNAQQLFLETSTPPELWKWVVTQTQKKRSTMPEPPASLINRTVDVVIISNATNRTLRQVTENCISSLLTSEDDIQFNVVVVESIHGINYDREGVETVYPETPFGYHAYLNLGRKKGSAPYVCLCNNDLVFEKKWASRIIRAMEAQPAIVSASPLCRHYHPTQGIKPNSGLIEGYQVAKHIAGWCIFQQRKIYETIKELDESFIFWYADNDYSETIKYHDLLHVLVTNSFVDHLASTTIRVTEDARRRQLTSQQKLLFDRKWAKT